MNFELETIKKVVDYIEENLNDELNLDKIAEKLDIQNFICIEFFQK
ncbi:MAG: hypothetical protein ACLS28_04210 [Clostridium neonatale]